MHANGRRQSSGSLSPLTTPKHYYSTATVLGIVLLISFAIIAVLFTSSTRHQTLNGPAVSLALTTVLQRINDAQVHKHFVNVNTSFVPSKAVGYPYAYPDAAGLYMNMTSVLQSCGKPDDRQVLAVHGFDETFWLHTFLRSWRMHSPQTQVVLFTSSWTPYNALHDPDNSRITVVLVKPKPTEISWNNWRIFLHARYLETCMDHYNALPEAIMISDGRDSALLGPIWEHPTVQEVIKNESALFALEGLVDQNLTISEQGINAFWVQQCFEGVVPPQVLDHVMKGTVSCSGTTLGAGQAMLKYVRAMVMTVMEIATSTCLEHHHGADQGVHNFVLHWLGSQGLLGFTPVTHLNGRSPIYTAAVGGNITMDRYGVIHILVDGKPTFIQCIHQYNRLEEVQARLERLYAFALTDQVIVDGPAWRKQQQMKAASAGSSILNWVLGRHAGV